MVRQTLITICLFLLPISAFAMEDASCEILALKKNGPPYNYNDRSAAAQERLRLAEGAHFTKSVRMGVAGNAGSLIGDLDFVLKVFPNHPYALSVMADLQHRPGFSRQHSLRRDRYYPTLNCYFLRAMHVAPNDPNVLLIQAITQHKQKDYQGAKVSYLKALAIKPDAAEVHYNLGLLLIKLGETREALNHAHSAYALGYPLSGLRDKLQSQGAWKEPEASSTDPVLDPRS